MARMSRASPPTCQCPTSGHHQVYKHSTAPPQSSKPHNYLRLPAKAMNTIGSKCFLFQAAIGGSRLQVVGVWDIASGSGYPKALGLRLSIKGLDSYHYDADVYVRKIIL